jgi:lysine-specific histone demethylase 1B
MDRSKFLKLSSLAAMGWIIGPSLVACSKNTLFENPNYKGKVLIIGAGAAGLYAGYLLQSLGIDFQILEARSMYGGRMGKFEGLGDYTVDTGAQWLHGNNSILADLVKKSKTKITNDTSENTYWYQNQLVKTLPKDVEIFDQEGLPDISFEDYALQQGFGSEYKFIVESLAGDQGADASQLSAYWNHKDEENWVAGDDDFKFQDTYFHFIDQNIAQPILPKIQLNAPIEGIDYTADKLQVKLKSGTILEADKVIVTVPISILKLNEIAFTPALPSAKTEAFQKFGMGPGMKVFLRFSTKFYEDFVLGGSICAAYADDTVGKTTIDNVLLAFIMGEQAAYLSNLGSDTAIIQTLLAELDVMYNNQASSNFLNGVVFDWTKEPYIKGAYGFSTVNMGDARKIAAQPIDNKLFFAGEAMNINGHHQTVHGAVESAYKAVNDLILNLK